VKRARRCEESSRGRAAGEDLPGVVLGMIVAPKGVKVVDNEAEVVERGEDAGELAVRRAGEQLLDAQAGHPAVGGVGVELCQPPVVRVEGPAAAARGR
jgi:hypothetical protein